MPKFAVLLSLIVAFASCLFSFSKAECVRPNIRNGFIKHGDRVLRRREKVPGGETVSAYCNDGYVASGGNSQAFCSNSGYWVLTETPRRWLRCISITDLPTTRRPRRCKKRLSIRHGSASGRSRSVGSIRSISCNAGYRMVGSAESVCSNRGEWIGHGKCRPVSDRTTTTTTTTTVGIAPRQVPSTLAPAPPVQYIDHPGNGGNYSNDESKCWNMSVPDGYFIKISMYSLDIEKCCDHLTFSNGTVSKVFDTAPGSSLYTSSQNVKLCFKSDRSVFGKGFRLSYEAYVDGEVVDCETLRDRGHTTDGIYTIYPRGESKPGFQVYCDMTSFGGGWVVFQRRVDSTQSFTKTWQEYKEGFGDKHKNFWLGNDHIHAITKTPDDVMYSKYSLLVKVVSASKSQVGYVNFDKFFIYNETMKYQLHVHPTPICDTTKAYSQFLYQNNKKFTTKDEDNDPWKSNCAGYGNGWWYGTCHHVSLNANFAGSTIYTLYWRNFKGDSSQAELKYSTMMMRRNSIERC